MSSTTVSSPTPESVRKSGRPSGKRKAQSETDSDVDVGTPKKVRPCSKAGCPAHAPICFVRATATCSGNGYTSRWYHVSVGEHFCNECFEYFYRSTKVGYGQYATWKRLWSSYGKTDNSVRHFMSDQMLPYWVECTACEKWRQLFRETEITPQLLKTYLCPKNKKNQSQEEACQLPEDFVSFSEGQIRRRVDLTKDPAMFFNHLQYPVFLQHAVYARYVMGYYPDGVGISPSNTHIHKYPEGVTEMRRYLHPLDRTEDSHIAMAFPPHYMTDEELVEFPDFARSIQICYLILRNTIVTLWNLNVKEWITRERVLRHLILRGLARIWLSEHINRVITFLTLKGYINHGIVSVPKNISELLRPDNMKHPVIVIGAGLSGLAAAKHLLNFGVQVTVLESSPRLGGRVMGDQSLGWCVGRGAQIVNGSYNNPIIILCKQADIGLREFSDHCLLFDDSGGKIDDKTDSRMEFHFNAMLDINSQMRKDKCFTGDTSLLRRFTELHSQFKNESGLKFSKVEESLLQFQVSNLEFACGGCLDNVSAMLWDQNENYPQFYGPPVLLQDGYTKVIERLAEDLSVVTDSQVISIDYNTDPITVHCKDGSQHQGSKVIVTVPLAILKDRRIEFTPPLPSEKTEALDSLGVGQVEKIALGFERKFWSEATKEDDLFGRVTMETTSVRGLFDVFYDLSRPQDERYVLVSYITGQAVDWMKDKSDDQVKDQCVATLRKIFPKEEVPEPEKYFLTRWYSDPHTSMSYSFIPVDARPDAYELMSRNVAEKVFFAGEATHQQYHQTVTGAYLSGIREAEAVYRSLFDV